MNDERTEDNVVFTRPAFAFENITAIPNRIMRNPNLTPGEKGMVGYLLSHRSGYALTMKQVYAENSGGRKTINTQIKGLEAAGFLRRNRVRDDLGRLGGYEWELTINEWGEPTSPTLSTGSSVQKGSLDVTSENTVKAQVGTSVRKANLAKRTPKKTTELKKTKNQEEIPPPKSSSTPLHQAEPKIEEEEYPQDLKTFVATLDYHGQIPNRAEYQRIARELVPLWGKVDTSELRRRLQHNAGVGAQSLVAVYVSRLKSLRSADFAPRKTGGGAGGSSGRRSRSWCDRPSVCDPRTSRLINDDGFVTTQKCPQCA